VVNLKPGKPTWNVTDGRRIAAGLSNFRWRRNYEFETHTPSSVAGFCLCERQVYVGLN